MVRSDEQHESIVYRRAEREGFEPSMDGAAHTGLRDRRKQAQTPRGYWGSGAGGKAWGKERVTGCSPTCAPTRSCARRATRAVAS